MIRFLSFLFLVSFTPHPGRPRAECGSDPIFMTSEQMLAHCEAKWGSRTSTVAQCVTNLRLAQAEATDVEILERIGEGEERDQAILASVDELGRKVDRLAAAQARPASQTSPTATVATTTASGVTYARTGGAAWAPVAQPTVVSIHSLNGMVPDTLHITDLTHSNARSTCGGVGATFVVFYDHGTPIGNVYAPREPPPASSRSTTTRTPTARRTERSWRWTSRPRPTSTSPGASPTTSRSATCAPARRSRSRASRSRPSTTRLSATRPPPPARSGATATPAPAAAATSPSRPTRSAGCGDTSGNDHDPVRGRYPMWFCYGGVFCLRETYHLCHPERAKRVEGSRMIRDPSARPWYGLGRDDTGNHA